MHEGAEGARAAAAGRLRTPARPQTGELGLKQDLKNEMTRTIGEMEG